MEEDKFQELLDQAEDLARSLSIRLNDAILLMVLDQLKREIELTTTDETEVEVVIDGKTSEKVIVGPVPGRRWQSAASAAASWDE